MNSSPTISPLDPTTSPLDPPTGPHRLPRQLARPVLLRRLSYIMLVRVILYTLVLGGTVAVYMAWGTPEELGGPYVTLLFVFIAAMYVLNIGYSLLFRYLKNLRPMAVIQVGMDLLVGATLVHFTGGSLSAFTFLFLLAPIAAAVTLSRKAAMVTAVAGSVLFCLVVLAGHGGSLPVLPGQVQLPWQATTGELGRSLVINVVAMFALAALSGYLAEQLRSVAETVEAQQDFIDDLAALNADIIRCLSSGLLTVNTEGVVLSMNQMAAQLLGLQNSSPLAGRPLRELVPEFTQAIEQHPETPHHEVTLQRQGKRTLLSLSISRLSDHRNQVTGAIVNFQDLTALRKMEEAVKRSEHLASLGRMAAGIAHEIRNPLASVSGSLELLRSADQLEQEDRQLMDIALREIERLNGLITDFLNFARPKEAQLRPLDLGQEITELVQSIAGLQSGKAGSEVVVSQTTPGLWVSADPDMVTAMLWNLVRNAWEAGEHQQVEIQVAPRGENEVALTVADQAVGIAPEQAEQVFEPFFTTKDQGTGLGLATVHRMVQDHGGTVSMQSVPGLGSTFTIVLPRILPPEL